MSDERSTTRKRTPRQGREPRDRSQAEPRLDRERALAELKRFVDLAIGEMRLGVGWDVSASAPGGANSEDADIVITFRGADEHLLLERNAELLLALEHIAHRWLRLDPRLHDRVRLDCGDYRAMRLAELKLSARVAAQRVRETGQPHRFNPMSSRERRIIHLELNGAQGVRTVSEGMGDRRQLVVYPASTRTDDASPKNRR
ncbi:MAG TPA: R3H domain-containing nucleic acid-binding protein [Candidatus Acidoferrales bacterium]|nr:R3H domain-containing nucleic acid-binding protein [Candidatus Acidoferrales bacterium]